MLAEEMLFILISDLEKEFKLAPTGASIYWRSTHYRDVSHDQMENMINKLVYEYKALQFAKEWEYHAFIDKPFGSCEVRKTDKFDEIYQKLAADYKMAKDIINQNEQKKENKPALWLDYTKDRKLIINDIFLLASTRNDSINDRMLRFLIEHPNKTYSRKELEDEGVLRAEKKEDKDFYVILDDIGMKGDLKKAFFSKELSKSSICLTNPVTQDDLKEKGIDSIDLRTLNKTKKA